jgi:hypothetical protein
MKEGSNEESSAEGEVISGRLWISIKPKMPINIAIG